MELGIIGFPQVGKKTIFSLLTGQIINNEKMSVDGGSVPGKAQIRDPRFDKLVNMYKPKKEMPGAIDFLLFPDIQNNAELDKATFKNLETVDAICCVIRAFKDDSVYHIMEDVNPIRDLKSFLEECILLDQMFVEKRLERIEKDIKKRKELIKEKEIMERMRAHLDKEEPLRGFVFTEEESLLIKSYPFISSKPVIVIVNVGDADISNPELIDGMKNSVRDKTIEFISISAKIEQEISQFTEEEDRTSFMKEIGITQPAINRFTILAYKVLGLLTYFTVGEDEVRAWMVKKGSSAPKAARAIHADFERGFIRAEVTKYGDLIELGSESAVKESGKRMLKGKEYIVEDGDIICFLFNV